MLTLRIQRLGKATILQCAGRMTFPDAEALRTAVLERPRVPTLVLDLANIILVDAAGLGMLVWLHQWTKNAGTNLKLMNLSPRLEDLLELTNLRSSFEICSAAEMLELLCPAILGAESVPLGPAIQDSNVSQRVSDPAVPVGA